jgi:hypothetical protein
MSDSKETDRRVWLMARAMARVLYPGISDEDLEKPAKRWNGTALGDADCSVWQDHVSESEAALAALAAEGFVEAASPTVSDLKRMVRRLAHKLERLDGNSLATQDARRLFDFDTAPRSQIEIEEAVNDLTARAQP